MALGFVPIEHYKTKFYQKEKESKRFTQITDEQLSAISDKVYKKMEIEEESSYYRTSKSSKLDRYIRALLYLTSPNIHFDIKTFDERLAYLIMMVDPNLVTFKEFLKINLVSLQEIANTEDVKLRNKMLEERKQTLLSYETAVRDQIGFFDVKLLKFEELFFKRFYAEKELITEVGQNNQDNLLLFAKAFIKEDLPTFERPNNGNSGNGKSGHCESFSALIIKFACSCFIFTILFRFLLLFYSLYVLPMIGIYIAFHYLQLLFVFYPSSSHSFPYILTPL